MADKGYGDCPQRVAPRRLKGARERYAHRHSLPVAEVKWHVDPGRFGGLHRDGQELINGWIDRASGLQENHFEQFIYAWIGFNGWASCCCEVEEDRALIDLMILDEDLAAMFEMQLAKPHVRAAAQRFADLWPIFKWLRYRISPT